MSIFDATPGPMTAFNGAQFIAIPDDSVFRPERTDTFSVECWVKTDSSGAMTLFGNLDASSVGWEMNMQAGGTVALELISTLTSSQLSVETDISVNDGKLHHILCTYGGASTPASIKIYIDGVSRTLSTLVNNLTTSIVSTGTAAIGAFADDSSAFFTGYLRNVGFFDYESSAADALVLFNLGMLATPNFTLLSGARPFGYWPLSKGAKDHGTGGNHGTNDGFADNASIIRAAAPGENLLSKAGSVSAIGDGGNSTPYNYDRLEAFTAAAWVRGGPGLLGFASWIFADFDPTFTNSGWGFALSGGLAGPNSLQIIINRASSSQGLSLKSVEVLPHDGLWHHVAFVKQATGARASDIQMYMDGELLTQSITSDNITAGTIQDGTNVFALFGRTPLGTIGRGPGKNLSIYAAALTQTDIRSIVARGRDGDISDLLDPAGNWLCNDPGNSSDFVDSSSNGIDISIPANESFFLFDRLDDQQYHLQFDGTYNFNGGGIHLFNRVDAYSVSFWYHKEVDVVAGHLITCFNGAVAGWGLTEEGGFPGLIRIQQNPWDIAGNLTVRTTIQFVPGWNHILFTKASGGCRASDVEFYINGVSSSKTIVFDTYTSGSNQDGTNEFVIGGRSGGSTSTNGRVKNANIYNSTLVLADAQLLSSMGPDQNVNDILAPASAYALSNPSGKTVAIDTAGSDDLAVAVGPQAQYRAV